MATFLILFLVCFERKIKHSNYLPYNLEQQTQNTRQKDGAIDVETQREERNEQLHAGSFFISPLLWIPSQSSAPADSLTDLTVPVAFSHRSAFHSALCESRSVTIKTTCFLSNMHVLSSFHSLGSLRQIDHTPLMTLHFVRKIKYIHEIIKEESKEWHKS